MNQTTWKAGDDAILEPVGTDFSRPATSGDLILIPAADLPKRIRVRFKKPVGVDQAEVEIDEGNAKGSTGVIDIVNLHPLTDAEVVEVIAISCNQLADNDTIATRADLPSLFGRLGAIIQRQHHRVEYLEKKLASLEKQIKDVDGRTRFQ